ncbi:hypothetical protein, partial [Pseudomonas sp. IT-P4]|uniref:hypothetical protein n=1 Tax=Pseudomonas sp. IT-P4 TaxID=3026446 RepID=UPI0039E135FD
PTLVLWWAKDLRLTSCHQLFEVVTAPTAYARPSINKSIKPMCYMIFELVTAHLPADCRLTEHSFSMASSRITSDQSQ